MGLNLRHTQRIQLYGSKYAQQLFRWKDSYALYYFIAEIVNVANELKLCA